MEDFPADQARYQEWIHPLTGSKYYWNPDKNSWMKGSPSSAMVYSAPNTPVDEIGAPFVPNNGDMWWDEHMLELRVWHKPPEEKYGRWVSSTNPQMALNDPQRNAIIGPISLIVSPTSYVLEEQETFWEVKRETVDGNDKYLEYEWIVTPPSVINNGEEIFVDISDGDSTRASIMWPKGTSFILDDGSRYRYSVRCRVRPKEGEESRFIEKWQYSETSYVYPISESPEPLPFVVMTKRTLADGEEIYSVREDTFGNIAVEWIPGDAGVVKINTSDKILFDVGTDVDYPEFATVFSSVPYEEYTGSQDVAVTYKEDYDTVDGATRNGYVIYAQDLTDEATRVGDVTVYYWAVDNPLSYNGEILFRS